MFLRTVALTCLLSGVFGAYAKHAAPKAWSEYTTPLYLYDIQTDKNDRDVSESDFIGNLLDIARTNLAKQIQLYVNDTAILKKDAIDGRTSVQYSAQTKFVTDVNLKLVHTKTSYNPNDKTGAVIAYIDRKEAREFFAKNLSVAHNNISNIIRTAEDYISKGFKKKAAAEFKTASPYFRNVDEDLLWLNTFGASESEISLWKESFNESENIIKNRLADLEHGTVIFLTCTADLFGNPYTSLENEIKGILAKEGCSFTTHATDADWIIDISCHIGQTSSSQFGNNTVYVSYVDAVIKVDKTATGQTVLEDEIRAKGSDTRGFKEAATDAYKKIKTEATEKLKSLIFKY